MRVFISGTQDDMRAERDVAADVVRSLGHEPVRAEGHSSSAAPPIAVCIEMARGCDLYVGLFGGRYGSVPAGMSVSVTELEFDIARGVDPRKILVFRKAGVTEEAQRRFLARVERFVDGYFRRPQFSSPAELATFLREDIPGWVTDQVRRVSAPVRGVALPVRPQERRPLGEAELVPLVEAMETGRADMRAEVLRDLESMSYRIEVEKDSTVRSWLARLLRGSVEIRVRALHTLGTFLNVTEPLYREQLCNQYHDAVLQQFSTTQDVAVKQEALNVFARVIRISDLPHVFLHVQDAANETYAVTKPFYLLDVLKRAGHEHEVRSGLYDLKNGATTPELVRRVEELFEYFRTDR